MMQILLLILAAVGMLFMVGQPVLAAAMHEGIVVKAGNDKLTMSDADGKNEYTHNVTRTTVITCNGKECKLDDLKKGYTVKVTATDDQREAIKIEAKSQGGK
jgi:hypothetical protein